MSERLKQADVILKKSQSIRANHTTYGRYEGEYEGVVLRFPHGLKVIYFRESDDRISADPHYENDDGLPDQPSFFNLLRDTGTYFSHLKSGRILCPDRLIVGRDASPGLVNLFHKRMKPTIVGNDMVYTFAQDLRTRQLQVRGLHQQVESVLFKYDKKV